MSAEDIGERLTAIAEELGDLAYDNLQQASSAQAGGEAPDPLLLANERRLTRARRAVEKAAQLVRGEDG